MLFVILTHLITIKYKGIKHDLLTLSSQSILKQFKLQYFFTFDVPTLSAQERFKISNSNCQFGPSKLKARSSSSVLFRIELDPGLNQIHINFRVELGQ